MAGTRKNTKKTVKPGKDLIESTIEKLQARLVKTIGQDIEELVIDMKGVNNVDSTGLGLLIAANNSLDKAGGHLSLTNVPEKMENLLRMIGLDKYFSVNAA